MAGQAHAFGYRNATMAADLADTEIELHTIADPNLALASSVAKRYGFTNAVAEVDKLLGNSDVDVVSVALPNHLHAAVLPQVIASGKHLFAEKPIGRTRDEAQKLATLAQSSSAVSGVGFSFRRLPGLAVLAQTAEDGAIGKIHTVRAWYNADYAADPSGPFSWRYSQDLSGGGALLDIGAHAIDAAQFVVGPIVRVLNSTLRTVIEERSKSEPGATGHVGKTTTELATVTNDDLALLTVEFGGGAVGQITLSRIATGIPNSLGIEIIGTQGHAHFDSLNPGEFQVFQNGAALPGFNGPRRIYMGPDHPYFTDVAAMPATGVGTGYAEAFVAEIQEFIRCVRDNRCMDTSFNTALAMMEVVEAALESSRSNTPTDVSKAVRKGT
jgi:predicted dehydrogenase